MRLFVALNLPGAIRDELHAAIAPLRETTSAIRWVEAPLLHVTIKFLGERGESVVGALHDALARVAARHAPLAIETTEVGAFPNFRRPRVVWIGMRGEQQMKALARDVDETFAPLGIEPERRPFQAHLTIGRVKRDMRTAEAVAVARAAADVDPRRRFSVRTVDLMQSELGAGGSRYTILASIPLHPRGS